MFNHSNNSKLINYTNILDSKMDELVALVM